MHETDSFMVGVVSSIVATILTSLVWLLWNRIKQRDILLSFLGLNRKEDTLICYGNVQKERLGETEEKTKYTTIEYGDIASTLLIFDRLKPAVAARVKHVVGSDIKMASQGNIVAIGGPKWNKVTEYLLGRMGSPIYFNQGTPGVIERRRTHQRENIYKSEVEHQPDGSSRVRGYGFIVCARSHFLGRAIPFAMIIAGFSSLGVLIATEFLSSMSSSVIRSLRKRLSDDKRFGLLIEGVVHVDSNGQTIGSDPPKLLSWIPEQDFIDPFSYQYWKN